MPLKRMVTFDRSNSTK